MNTLIHVRFAVLLTVALATSAWAQTPIRDLTYSQSGSTYTFTWAPSQFLSKDNKLVDYAWYDYGAYGAMGGCGGGHGFSISPDSGHGPIHWQFPPGGYQVVINCPCHPRYSAKFTFRVWRATQQGSTPLVKDIMLEKTVGIPLCKKQ